MKRAVLLVALVGSSCASPPRLLPGKAFEWKPNESFNAKVELQEEPGWIIRLDMSSRFEPCVGNRKDGSLDMEALFTLENGTEVKGSPTRVMSEWASAGVFRTIVVVPLPSPYRPSFLKLHVRGLGDIFRIVMDVY